jgi:hypothetical protein
MPSGATNVLSGRPRRWERLFSLSIEKHGTELRRFIGFHAGNVLLGGFFSPLEHGVPV